ncbi:hypothetical protein LY90DRAFT_664746 [Neocallimastix californiae]|uniref:Uncharacterized protein n=1 Tax=Neocallimastix californiae TaxID=1754190 RepID=A0A1Y2F623_9FUNG|nr:hypothetical protein LY90DRAFT_664746 [Neocallimastix californiae]|eukprot:ORY79117.1 hypothetical protein LY90DRAFT_664746 [Neocallimastix californiae]
MTDINTKTNSNDSKTNNFKFDFNNDRRNSNIKGTQSRLNNHLLIKDNASLEHVYIRRGSTDSTRNLKIKKNKKKFTWANVQNAIKKTFHPGSNSKKKLKKKGNEHTDSIIISSAVYEDEKHEKSQKGNEEKKENITKEDKKSLKIEEKGKEIEKEKKNIESFESEENINHKDQNDTTVTETFSSSKLSDSKLNISNNESSINKDKPNHQSSEQVQHIKSNSVNKVKNKIENKEENKVEDKVEEKVEDKVEDKVEEKVEDKVEDKVENKVENKVEDKVENKVENKKEYKEDKDKNTLAYPSNLSNSQHKHNIPIRPYIVHTLKDGLNHEFHYEKDVSGEFLKNICGNYYSYESDESSESAYSNPDFVKGTGTNYLRENHHKELSISYPSIPMEKENIEAEGIKNVYPEDSIRVIDELSHLHCIMEEKVDSNSNIGKIQNNDGNNSKNDSEENSIENGSNEISSLNNYRQNNISVPDIFNIRSKSKENNYRGHGKTNSYSYNDPKIFKSNINGNSNMHTSLSTCSAISSSNYSGNLFGAIQNDTNDKLSDKYRRYHSLRSDSRSNSIIKIRNSSRDIYLNFKKNEPRSRIDKSLNGNISKRSKKTLNTIYFKANYLNENSMSYSNDSEENASYVDISSGLTAKAFADLVGINVLYDNDEKEDNAYLQKQGQLAKPSDTHNITDFSIFIPPNSTEMAALHTSSVIKPVNKEELETKEKENNIIDTDETNRIPNDTSSVSVTAISTEITQPDYNSMPFNKNTKDILNQNLSDLSRNSTNVETPTDDSNEGKLISSEITSANHTFTITTNRTSIIKNPSSSPRTLSYDKERNTITQSTVSAKGRTFEVSFSSSNTEYLDKSKPITSQTQNIINQGSKVKNSKTEPNIHNLDSSNTLSRNSSCSSNKLVSSSKSTVNIRNTSVSIVHGGPTEEMCRSILEKANSAIKIDREFSRISDSFISGKVESNSNDSTFESIKTGEIQANPINHINLNCTTENNSPPISTMGSNSPNESINYNVITYNRPIISNNSRVIFFKSKRNNYINLQSTSIDGNKHRQFHRRKYEISTNKSNNYDKPSIVEEVEEETKDSDAGKEMKVSSSRRNSVFYSLGPTIKNLHNFSFTSNRRSSQSSMSYSPNNTILNSTFDSTKGNAYRSNAIDEANFNASSTHATENTETKTLTPSMTSTMITLETTVKDTEINLSAQLSSNFLLPEISNSIHPKINQINKMTSEQKDSFHSLFDTPHFSIVKSQAISNSTPSTPRRTRTIITTSKDNNNNTVITTTKTTSNHHTFITTKTTSIKNGNTPKSSMSIDSNNSISSTSFPITDVQPTSNIQSGDFVENELIDMNNNQSTMGNDTNTSYFNSSVSTNSTLTSKQGNYYNDSLGGIDNGNSFYKCGKNLSSYDVPNSSLSSVGKVRKFRAVSLSNPRCSNLYDIGYNPTSNSNLDISSLDKHEIKDTSSVIRPLMISNPNSIKVSNEDVLLGLDSTKNLNNCIPKNISNTDNNTFVSEQLNNTMTESSISEVNRLNISDSLSINNNGNTLIIQPIVPKNLHIPHTSNTQIIIDEHDGNISISSKLTTEETKGRFQIEKSEDISTTIILPTNDNYEETKLINQRKCNSYCNGDKPKETHDKNEAQILTHYSNSEMLDLSDDQIDYKFNNSTLSKDNNEFKLSGNKNKNFGIFEQCSIINNSIKSISEKNNRNNEHEVNSINSDSINDQATINSASPTKKKEIVKGRFTITTDS